MTLPFPQNEESRAEFTRRWHLNKAVLKAHPAYGPRTAALERTWTKAKAQSVVSVKTSETEVLLFGSL